MGKFETKRDRLESEIEEPDADRDLQLWDGDDISELVWTPRDPCVASPLASGINLADTGTWTDLLRSSSAVRELYANYVDGEHRHLIRCAHQTVLSKSGSICLARHDASSEGAVKCAPGKHGVTLRLTTKCKADWNVGDGVLECHTRSGPSGTDVFWFLRMLTPGVRLRINHTQYRPPANSLIGPLSPFTILEYFNKGPAVSFLFLNVAALDYTPVKSSTDLNLELNFDNQDDDFFSPEAGKTYLSDSAEPINIEAFRRQERRRPEVSTSQDSRLERARAALEEVERKNNPSAYFRNRLEYWRERERAEGNGKLVNPIVPSGEILASDCLRGISAVTEAIRREHGVEFTFTNEQTIQFLPHYVVRDSPFLRISGARREWLLPWTVHNHHFLIRVLEADTPDGGNVQCHVYDSMGFHLENQRHVLVDQIRQAILNSGWFETPEFPDAVPTMPDDSFIWPNTAQQGDGTSCGVITVLNAWICAFGLWPVEYEFPQLSYGLMIMARELINLALAGFMDSNTITAFLRSYGLVDRDANVPADRTFSRTMAFYNEAADLDRQLQTRVLADIYTAANTQPFSLESTVAIINRAFGSGTVWEGCDIEDLENGLRTWLESTAATSVPSGEASPSSPGTMTLALTSEGTFRPFDAAELQQLPEDELRQIFAYFRAQLNVAEAVATRERIKAVDAQNNRTTGVDNGGTSSERTSSGRTSNRVLDPEDSDFCCKCVFM
ncbi:hypothetical protein MBLNU459_g7368t1 [Dothideomycetes sp. NU459]